MGSKLFIDVETSGLGNNAAIIEIAAIPMVDGQELDPFHSMVRPHDGATLDPEAFKITGIDIKEIWTYPEPKEVLDEFIKWIDKHETIFSLAGHNINFDRNKLFRFFCRHGHYSSFITRISNSNTCTLSWCREVFKGKRNKPVSFKLADVCRFFEIETDVSHRAMADIANTIKVYHELEKLIQKEEAPRENISFMEKRRKYLDMKYIQMNPEGDIFITTDATKDPVAMRFILDHLWNMYGTML